jgi:hypothetical protein
MRYIQRRSRLFLGILPCTMVLQGKSPGKDGGTVKYIQKRSRLSLGSKPLYRLTVKQVDMSAGMNLRDSAGV